jgi:hypothetical protein
VSDTLYELCVNGVPVEKADADGYSWATFGRRPGRFTAAAGREAGRLVQHHVAASCRRQRDPVPTLKVELRPAA